MKSTGPGAKAYDLVENQEDAVLACDFAYCPNEFGSQGKGSRLGIEDEAGQFVAVLLHQLFDGGLVVVGKHQDL